MTTNTTMISKELSRNLDKQIHSLSEMRHDDLVDLQSLLERAHLHVLIERQLREGTRVSEVTPRP